MAEEEEERRGKGVVRCRERERREKKKKEGEKKISENKLPPIQYSWIKSWLPFTLIFFHYV